MPSKVFKMNIFDVELNHANYHHSPTTFREAIERAGLGSLTDREKVISGKRRRLDAHQLEDDRFLLNFVTFEYSGTGRVREGQPTQTIPIERDESFSPETAMLYDPATNLALVESSATGMGPGTIVRYFETFVASGTTYTLRPRADNDAAARARRHQVIRNLSMRIALGPITDLDRDAGIDPLKGFAADYGAAYIDIELKTERPRDRSLVPERIQELVAGLLGGSGDIPNVPRLQVTGREHDDEPLEVIDLIQHRERRQRVLEIDPTTRKVPHQSRWDALKHEYRIYTRP